MVVSHFAKREKNTGVCKSVIRLMSRLRGQKACAHVIKAETELAR